MPCPQCPDCPALADSAASDAPTEEQDCKTRLTYPDAPQWTNPLPLSGDMITCDFRLDSWVGIEGRELQAWSSKASEPFVVTFSGVGTDQPRMKGNLGTSTLTKSRDDDHELVLVERTALGNVVTYAINRRSRLAVLSKAYFHNNRPMGFVMLGRCY